MQFKPSKADAAEFNIFIKSPIGVIEEKARRDEAVRGGWLGQELQIRFRLQLCCLCDITAGSQQIGMQPERDDSSAVTELSSQTV